MLSWIGAAFRVVTFPISLGWKGYSALWWAFEDDAPKPIKPAAAAAIAATAKPDAPEARSTVPASLGASNVPVVPLKTREKPIRALKQGYVATIVMSVVGAVCMTAAHNEHAITSSQAGLGTLWLTGLASVVSLLAVRRGVRRREKLEAAAKLNPSFRARVASGVLAAPKAVGAGCRSFFIAAKCGVRHADVMNKLRRSVQ